MFRAVVSVNFLDHLRCHASETGNLIDRDCRLHFPSHCRMPQDVRYNFSVQSGIFSSLSE